jgi:hypothetical protein
MLKWVHADAVEGESIEVKGLDIADLAPASEDARAAFAVRRDGFHGADAPTQPRPRIRANLVGGEVVVHQSIPAGTRPGGSGSLDLAGIVKRGKVPSGPDGAGIGGIDSLVGRRRTRIGRHPGPSRTTLDPPVGV